MNEKYQRIYDEIQFSKELLGIGLTFIRKANFSNKGVYFQSFSSLSLGLERIMKICLILDCYSKNKKFPTRKEMKDIGHDLTELNGRLLDINGENNFREIHLNILDFLSKFAKSTRYSNIDFVTNDYDDDPICNWAKHIDHHILDHEIKEKDRDKLFVMAGNHASFWNTMPAFTMGYETDKRKDIHSSGDLYSEALISEYIAGYRVLFLIDIIEYIYKTLIRINVRLGGTEYYLYDISRVFSVILYGSKYDKRMRKNFIREY